MKLFQSITMTAKNGPDDSQTGHSGVDEVIAEMSHSELLSLLRHVRNWNSSTRTSDIAQRVLYAILKLRSYQDLFPNTFDGTSIDVVSQAKTPAKQEALSDVLAGLIPYTERSIRRLDRLIQDSYVVDLVIGEMDSGFVVDEFMDVESGV